MVEPAPFLADVQTNVLRSVDPRIVVYLFFRITNRRDFVSGLPRPPRSSRLRHQALAFSFKSELERVPDPRPHRAEAESLENDFVHKRRMSLPFEGFANIAFTYTGLKALGVHERTLGTFPEPFRDGMAARAATLGDVGEIAPDRWDGYLGSREVHGVKWLSIVIPSQLEEIISTGYDIVAAAVRDSLTSSWISPDVAGAEPYRIDEVTGQLRCILEAFGMDHAEAGGADPPHVDDPLHDAAPRVGGAVSRRQNPLHIRGAEVLHVEVGRANYLPGGDGQDYRVEHFGYRDGVSQPYADLGLNPPAPGGGDAARQQQLGAGRHRRNPPRTPR